MSTQSPPVEVQSLRVSCDRCRSKKLGCTISSQPTGTGAKQCMRCQNAKVDCVFGRRAPNTRRSSAARPNPSAAGLAERKTKPLAAKTPAGAEKKLQQNKMAASAGRLLSPPATLEELLPADPSSDCTIPLSNAWYNGLALGSGLGCARGENRHPADDAQNGFFADNTLDHDFLMDPCPLPEWQDTAGLASLWGGAPDSNNWMSWESLSPTESPGRTAPTWSTDCSSAPLTAESLPELSSLNSPHNTTVNTAATSPSSHAVKNLSDLVRDIHCTSNEMLAVAAEPPCPQGPDDLQRYPVSQVLGLARRLYAGIHDFLAARPAHAGATHAKSPLTHRHRVDSLSSMAWEATHETFEARSRNQSPSLGAAGDSQGSAAASSPRATVAAPPSSSSATGADLDTAAIPIMLLIVSCYMSLARLYQTTFAQMQDLVPRAAGPASGDDAACSRLYVAVQMLLDEFQSVEDALAACGGGGSNAHDRRCGGDAVEAAECTTAWFAAQLRTAQAVLEQEVAGAGGGRMCAGMNLKATLRERIYLCA